MVREGSGRELGTTSKQIRRAIFSLSAARNWTSRQFYLQLYYFVQSIELYQRIIINMNDLQG